MQFRSMLLLVVLFISVSYQAISQSLQQKVLSLEEAETMIKAAQARASQDNWNVVIAIIDAGGHLICLHRMDNTQIGSVEVAQKKAKAALYFKRPTKAFQDAIEAGNTGMMLLPNVIASEGGVPIMHEGQVIGAIGVSGVTSAQDGIIAKAALDTL